MYVDPRGQHVSSLQVVCVRAMEPEMELAHAAESAQGQICFLTVTCLVLRLKINFEIRRSSQKSAKCSGMFRRS